MTEEEKKAKAEAKKEAHRAALMAPRAGTRQAGEKPPAYPSLPAITKGLELSEVVNKPLAWFKEDEENAADFQAMKDKRPQYWADLKRDISEAGIITPLLATDDGHLLQGHSRLTIAKELGIARVPVQIIESGFPQDPAERAKEIRKRRRLDNLLRFEIDEDHRLAMFIEIWPEFYLDEKKPGRQPLNSATVAPLAKDKASPGNSATVAPLTYEGMAKEQGKSVRAVKADVARAKAAKPLAETEGYTTIQPKHLKQVREQENTQRRTKATMPDPAGAIETLKAQLTYWADNLGNFSTYKTGVFSTLDALWKNGYITAEQRAEILAGIKEPTEKAE
jgi:hypothetical protein